MERESEWLDMEISEAIEECKKYTQDSFDIWAIPSSYECEELRIAINTVLEELNNRIPKERIKNLNKIADDMIAKAEENMKYGRYKQYGGKIKFHRLLSRLYGYKEVLNILLDKEQIL